MRTPIRRLILLVLPLCTAGCPVMQPGPHSPTTPPPQGADASSAPDASGEPFHDGVADPRPPARPRVRESVPRGHRPPPRAHRPVVDRAPPPQRRAVVERPTVARPVVGDAVDKTIASLAGASSLSRKRTLILLLGRTRDPRAVDALVRTLKSREPVGVRAFAADALGRLGASWSVRSLASLVSARDMTLRSAARKSLARLCRAPGAGTYHYLRIVSPRDGLPKKMLAGRMLLLSLAKSYAKCPDCVLRWPACSASAAKRNGRPMGFELQPRIQVIKSGDTTSLNVSMLVLTHPKGALKGTLSAKATFDVDLSRPFVKYVLQSLTEHLKGNIDVLVKKVRLQTLGR